MSEIKLSDNLPALKPAAFLPLPNLSVLLFFPASFTGSKPGPFIFLNLDMS